MNRLSICRLCFAAFCLALLAAPAVPAPLLPISTMKLVPGKTDLQMDLTINPVELTFFPELDMNCDGHLAPGEWTGHGQGIARRILEVLKVRVNDQLVVATIAGLSQSYETEHISVRAHFFVDARRARVSLESHLTEVAGDSHITQVTCGTGPRVQATQLDRQSNRVTFEPMEAVDAPGAGAGNGAIDSSFKAFTVNETGVMLLLCLFLLAAFPPILFCELVRRRHAVPSRAASFIPVPQATH